MFSKIYEGIMDSVFMIMLITLSILVTMAFGS